jgi:hypothetical protein
MTVICKVLAAFLGASCGARSFPVEEERRMVYFEKSSGRGTTAGRYACTLSSINEINGAIAGFLGTYSSRYSDFRGYWLMPRLLSPSAPLTFDLMGTGDLPNDPCGSAERLAREKFSQQLAKHRRKPSDLKSATLEIRTSDTSKRALAGPSTRDCYTMTLSLVVAATLGKHFKRQIELLVAPHNPHFELRRAESNWRGLLNQGRVAGRWSLVAGRWSLVAGRCAGGRCAGGRSLVAWSL